MPHVTFNGDLPARPVAAIYSDGTREAVVGLQIARERLLAGYNSWQSRHGNLRLAALASREGHRWPVRSVIRGDGSVRIISSDGTYLILIHRDHEANGS